MALEKNLSLIWLDLEMTGLNPSINRIIEIATVITDAQLNVIAEGPAMAIFQPEEILSHMDDWNQNQHTQSGLVNRIRHSQVDEAQAEQLTLEFLSKYLPPKTSPICGNTIYQDRRFLYKWMPQLESFFHYRNVDVSTIKELALRWYPQIVGSYKKDSTHTALADVYDSINELKFYREKCFIP